MKDYWRLIGVNETATPEQIRQAHFRAFRYYQGEKNNNPSKARQAVAELAIEYLRQAHYNPDLPIFSSIKQLLPPLPDSSAGEVPSNHAPEIPPTEAIPIINRANPIVETIPPTEVVPIPKLMLNSAANKPITSAPSSTPLTPSQPSSANPETTSKAAFNPGSNFNPAAPSPTNQPINPSNNREAIPKTQSLQPPIGPTPVMMTAAIKPTNLPTKDPVKPLAPALPPTNSPSSQPTPADQLPVDQLATQTTPVTKATLQANALSQATKEAAKKSNSETLIVPPSADSVDLAQTLKRASGPSPLITPSTPKASKINTYPTTEGEPSLITPGLIAEGIPNTDNLNSPPNISHNRSGATASSDTTPTTFVANDEIDVYKTQPIRIPTAASTLIGTINAATHQQPAESELDLELDPDFAVTSALTTTAMMGVAAEPEIPAALTPLIQNTRTGRQVILNAVISCPDCEWEILSQTDSYCSGCGKSITSVAVPRELVVYIGESGSYTKAFTIENNGLIPVTITNFEVQGIQATVMPTEPTVLDKGESLSGQLHVAPENLLGRRSGHLRFLYHGKPCEIPLQLKDPPHIKITFPHIVTDEQPNGLRLRLPIGSKRFTCRIETDSPLPLPVTEVRLNGQVLAWPENHLPPKLQQYRPWEFEIPLKAPASLVLAIEIAELGVREVRLRQIELVEVANLVAKITDYSIREHAIILGSGRQTMKLQLVNEYDESSGRGRGRAEQIRWEGQPSWLQIQPPIISELATGDSCEVTLFIDSDKVTVPPHHANVPLILRYFDSQLGCERQTDSIDLPFEFTEPRHFTDWVAVDFGTSNTCAAFWDQGQVRSLVVETPDWDIVRYESPTCIQFVDEAHKHYECGAAAYAKRFSGARAVKATAWAFKTRLSSENQRPQTYLDVLHGRAHTKTVDELIVIYVSSLLERIKLRNGIAPRKAIVTFPVTFGKPQRERLMAAFRQAGLAEVTSAISEPVALAIHYAQRHLEISAQASTFAVFDFGGGTTDLAIFQISPATPEQPTQLSLCDVSGVSFAGERLTFEIARFIYQKLVPTKDQMAFAFPENFAALLDSPSDIARQNYYHLAQSAERIKRALGEPPLSGETAGIFDQPLPHNLISPQQNRTFSASFTAAEITTMLRPYIVDLATALQTMLAALEQRHAQHNQLDFIILGGNCRGGASSRPSVRALPQAS